MDMTACGAQTRFLGPAPKDKNHVSLLIYLEHLFSRGTVYDAFSDPTKPPTIDPGYFRNAVDAEILPAGLEWLDKVAKAPALAKCLVKRLQPGLEVSLESEGERIGVLENHVSTQYQVGRGC
jgi:hypothetical protein